MKKIKAGIDHPRPEKVTGASPVSHMVDDVDRLSGSIEQIDGSGTQVGEHPHKAQNKIMRYIQ